MSLNVLSRARVGLLVLSLCLGIAACEKKEVVEPGPKTEKPGTQAPFEGEPTAVGTPTGDKVSQSIGPEGGVVRTADGNVSLTVPAGALSQPTTISLQPVENKAFLGIGSAYEFSPDGLKFAKPAQLTVKYAAGSLNGTSPEAIGIAFQDEKRAWQGKAAKVNPTEGTFTASVPHFSSWAFFKYYSLFPEVETLALTQVLKLEVLYLKGSAMDPDVPVVDANGEINVVPLIPPKLLKADQVKNWRVNGQDLNGRFDETIGGLTLLDEGAAAEYKAPSKVPPTAHNPIAVSVELKSRQGQLILISNLTIAAENEMTVKGKRYENPLTEALYMPGAFSLLMSDRRAGHADVTSITASVFRTVKGTGSFPLGEECDITAALAGDEHVYKGYWIDEQGETQYDNGKVIITEFNGQNKPVAGTLSATLHYQSDDGKEHKTIEVKATFKTLLGSE
ncbi:MAG: hypothetical protein ICV83_22200 [Cytophagales bacterium]|nr:hypothetical protein [Cytophagales bacterium]